MSSITCTPDELNAMRATHNACRRYVAQSVAIHPSWDADAHLSFLRYDAYMISHPTQLLDDGDAPAPAAVFVARWLDAPERYLPEAVA